MQVPSATFRSRLFRVFMIVGLVVALLSALAVSMLDSGRGKKHIAQDSEQVAQLIGALAKEGLIHENWDYATQLSPLFEKLHGLNIICIYNRSNKKTYQWQSQEYDGVCPAIIHEYGTTESFFAVHVAFPVYDNAAYLGIVYTASPALPVNAFILRGISLFGLFFLLALCVSSISAYYGARHMTALMAAIGQQIDCLMDHKTSECTLMPTKATRETMALFDGIRNLHIHLESLLVPKETFEHMRQWYENIFFNLFLLLRRKLPEDSPLLPLLTDCELLVRLNNPDEIAPREEAVHMARLVDEARSSARALDMPASEVHLVASFKAGLQNEWVTQPAYLQSLIRHVLLIGLGRTECGLVSFRAEVIIKFENTNRAVLAWQMEDSGPPMQQGALHSALLDKPYKMVSIREASWLLTVQLTKRLKGSCHGENSPKGLRLKGEIPLTYPEFSTDTGMEKDKKTFSGNKRSRLVLMIGDVSADMQKLCQMFARSNCRVVMVANHIQALELAPAMPFSVIIFSPALFKENRTTAIRRLIALMDTKIMPVIPLWAVATSDIAAEHSAWGRMGVSQILSTPVKQEKIIYLCHELMPFDETFWAISSEALQQEFSASMMERLPELRTEFSAQIVRVRDALMLVSRKNVGSGIMHEVHGVKSAALALGYMRIAVLMANLEHILAGKLLQNAPANITVIAECLKEIQLV